MEFLIVVIVLTCIPFSLIQIVGRFWGRKGVVASFLLLTAFIGLAWMAYEQNPDVGTGFVQWVLLPIVMAGIIIGAIVGYIRN